MDESASVSGAATEHGESVSAEPTEAAGSIPHEGAVVLYSETPYDGDGADVPPEPEKTGRSWLQEVPRWLATLDAPSTRREYEKAVRYFFETDGVPQIVGDLTYDLLIAYRGSLARRAERGATRPSAMVRSTTVPTIATERSDAGALPGPDFATNAADEEPTRDGSMSGANRTGPLAPATANLRITALRRFLLHCALWDLLPSLSSDRIAAALRRLRIERRRPYQVLAEPEWGAFLAAARRPDLPTQPAVGEPESHEQALAGDSLVEADANMRGPWGTPRAVRRRLASEVQADHAALPDTNAPQQREPRASSAHVRSRAGLTGVRTARRDHALLALALATGLRAIELCALDVGDLHREWHSGHEEWWLILPDEKTKGQRGGRTLPLGPELARTLLDYVATTERRWERSQDRTSPLFLSNRRRNAGSDDAAGGSSRRLSTAQVRRIVDRVEAQWATDSDGESRTGYDGMRASRGTGRAISPHALRHSTAVALLEGNETTGRPPASVEHVRGWLGHFDIRTTQGYLAHVDSRRHRRPFALDPARHAGGTNEEESED